jgi:hypothetical protein
MIRNLTVNEYETPVPAPHPHPPLRFGYRPLRFECRQVQANKRMAVTHSLIRWLFVDRGLPRAICGLAEKLHIVKVFRRHKC